MDFKCPKCERYGFDWDGRAKVMRCLYNNCQFVCKIRPSAGKNWRHDSPNDAEKQNACLFAKAALTGGMYVVPEPGFNNDWSVYVYAVNVVRQANNFPMLTNEQCNFLDNILMGVLLKGAKNYAQLKEKLAAAAAEYGKSDWPEEDRKRGYVLQGDEDD